MTTGMVLGKFMPPHAGHLHLIRTARALCDELVVVVGTQPGEPLDGRLRADWMRRLCPGCRVVHLHRTLPQLPHEHPDFWALWTDALDGVMGGRPDVVFAGEDYGAELARRLGARFVPVPRAQGLQVSGTQVRADPERVWDLLPGPVRGHYAKRVRVVGPESAGKTTLSRALARALDGTWVAEFARGWIEARGGALELGDLDAIATGQAASEDALAELGRPWVLCDTDPALTAVWSHALFGQVSSRVRAAGVGRRYHATLLVAPTDAWVPDVARYQPERAARTAFFEACVRAYPDAVVVDGPWDQRLDAALAALSGDDHV